MRLRKAILLLAVLVGLLLALGLYRHSWKSRSRTAQSAPVTLISRHDAVALYSQIGARGDHFMTDDKLQVSMPFSKYSEDVPLIIIAPRIRTLEGALIEASPYKMEFSGNDGKPSSGSWDLTGRELCLAIPQEELVGSLSAGRTYLVYSCFKATGNDAPLMKHTTQLTTPENVANGQVYRVELVVKDERREQQLAERAAEAAKRYTIDVRFDPGDLPVGLSDAVWVGTYHDGKRGIETFPTEDGLMQFRSANRLGGELLVNFVPREADRWKLWAYVRNVEGQSVSLPDDADFVLQQDKLVSAVLSLKYRDAAQLRGLQAVMLYAAEDTHLPLNYGLTDLKERNGLPSKTDISLEVIPGTYHVRATYLPETGRKQTVPLGTLTISPEPRQAQYEIALPKAQ